MAEIGNEVVAVLFFMMRHVENALQVTRNILFIDAMAVDENFRRQGVGRKMFERVKEIARERNCDGIELQVNARNKEAFEMYRRCGFTEKSVNMELL